MACWKILGSVVHPRFGGNKRSRFCLPLGLPSLPASGLDLPYCLSCCGGGPSHDELTEFMGNSRFSEQQDLPDANWAGMSGRTIKPAQNAHLLISQ